MRDVPLILPAILAPLRTVPGHPAAMSRFGLEGLLPASVLSRRFRGEQARALIAGAAAHTMLPLTAPLTSAFGLLFLMTAHSVGWPVVEGGSARLTDALVAEITSLGGRVETGRWVQTLDDLPQARAVLLDVSPRQFIALAGDRLPARERRALERFRYGPGVCKVDWALSGPVPWQAPACREAGTVHLGGTFAEVARSESDVAAGRHPEHPFCLVAQPGVVDPSRAPDGKQTLWGYCHVPSGSTVDMTDRIEAQIERFVPGFRDLILARSIRTAAEMGAAQPQLHRRRDQRRRRNAAPDDLPADAAVESVPDCASRGLPVLGIYPARRRGARDVRRLGCPDRSGRPGREARPLTGDSARPPDPAGSRWGSTLSPS